MNSIAAQSYFGGPKPTKNSASEEQQAKPKDKTDSVDHESAKGGKWGNLCIFALFCLLIYFLSFRYDMAKCIIYINLRLKPRPV